MEISATYGIVSYLLVDNWLRSARNAWFPRAMWNCVPCNGVFVIILLKTMFDKTVIRLGFCDIWSNLGRGTLSVIEAVEIMFIIRWRWTPSRFHTDGLCDGKCISCLRTAILCRVVQRIYRVFRISHCLYIYRYSECVSMVQCGKSNMTWKRFFGATRSVWCDCFLSRKVWVLKSYYCTQVHSLISINWTSPLKLARLGCFNDNYQSLNNYILGHFQRSLCANFTCKWNFLAA